MQITKSELKADFQARRIAKRIIKWSMIIILIAGFLIAGNLDKLILTI